VFADLASKIAGAVAAPATISLRCMAGKYWVPARRSDMFGRVFVAIFVVLFAAAALPACSQLSGRAELEECKSTDRATSLVACSAILSRKDRESANRIRVALLHRALTYEALCKLPAALADFRELARREPQDEATTTAIRKLEHEIAANVELPAANVNPPPIAAPQPADPDAITWRCIVKWDEPDIELLRSFITEVPQSVHRRDAEGRIAKLEGKARERQAQFNDQVLLGAVGGTALGSVILAALLMRGWRSYAVPAFFGLLAGIMVEPVLQRTIVQPIYSITVTSMLLGISAALAARFIAEGFFEKLMAEIRDEARETLVPERWGSPQGLAKVSARDQVKRWFVTIAATTGFVVGSMFGLEVFWTTLVKTIEPRSFVFAALLVGVSMFLTGPLQAYVFDVGARADHPSDPSKKISDLFAAGIDWRAAGRFGLVFLAYIQIYLLTSCVGAAIKEGNARTVSIIFAAAATPAIVSYYWSAALQRGVPSVRNATFKPSLYAGAIMGYGTALTVVLSYVSGDLLDYTPGKDTRPALLFFFLSPVIAILPALVIGAVTTLIYSVGGAIAIDRFSRKSTMFFIAVTLLIAATIHALIATYVLGFLGFSLANIRYITFLGSIVGWLVGLWASGFPRLLMHEAVQDGRAQ
jgi:hypothetical protein